LELSNGPPKKAPSWYHILFPLENLITVEAGDHLLMTMRMNVSASEWQWQISTGGDEDQADSSVDTLRTLKQSTAFGQFSSLNANSAG
jgi:hypothetical protein